MKGSAAQIEKANDVITLIKMQLSELEIPDQVPSEDADPDDFFFDDDDMRDVGQGELAAFNRITDRLLSTDDAAFVLDYLNANPVPLLQSLCHAAKFAKWDESQLSIKDGKVARLVGFDDLKSAETLIHALV